MSAEGVELIVDFVATTVTTSIAVSATCSVTPITHCSSDVTVCHSMTDVLSITVNQTRYNNIVVVQLV